MSCVVDIEVLISTLPSIQTVREAVQESSSSRGSCDSDAVDGLGAFPSILSSWQLLLDRVVNTSSHLQLSTNSSSSSSSKPPSILFTLESQSPETEVFVAQSMGSNTSSTSVFKRGQKVEEAAQVVKITSSGGAGNTTAQGVSTKSGRAARWEKLPAHGRLIDTTVSFSMNVTEEEEYKRVLESLSTSKSNAVFSSSIPAIDRRTIELGRPALFVKESTVDVATTLSSKVSQGILVDVSVATTTPSPSLLHFELCYRRRFAAVLVDACLEGAVEMYGDRGIALPEVPCVALLSTMSPSKLKHGSHINNHLHNGGFTDESGDDAFLPPPPPFIIVQGPETEQRIAETLHDIGMGAYLASADVIVKMLQDLSHLVTCGGGGKGSSPLQTAESGDEKDGEANVPTSEALSAMSRERKRRSREGRVHTTPGEAGSNDAVNLALQALPLFQNSEPLLNGSVVTNSGGSYTRSPVYIVKSEDFCSVFGGWFGVPFGTVREGICYINSESQERVRSLRSKLRFIVCVQRDQEQSNVPNPLICMLSGSPYQRPYISHYLRCETQIPSSQLKNFVTIDIESASFLRRSSKIVGGEASSLNIPPALPTSPATGRVLPPSILVPPPLSSYLGVLSNTVVLPKLSLPLSKRDDKGKVVKSIGPTGDATILIGPNTLQLNVLRSLEPASILSKTSSVSFSLTPSSRVTSSTALLLAATRARGGVASNSYMRNLFVGRRFYLAQSPCVPDAARDAISACNHTIKEFSSSISTLWSHLRSTTQTKPTSLHTSTIPSAATSECSASSTSSLSVLSQISEEYTHLMQVSKNIISTSRNTSESQRQSTDGWLERTSGYITGMGGSVVYTPSEATHVVVWDLDELMRQMDCVSKKRLPKLNPLLPPATGVEQYHHSLKRLIALVSSLTAERADEVSTAITSKLQGTSTSPLLVSKVADELPHHHAAFSVTKILRQLRAALKAIMGSHPRNFVPTVSADEEVLSLAEQRTSLLQMIQSAPGDANIVDVSWLESCASSAVQQIPPMCCWAVSDVFVKSATTPSITFDIAEEEDVNEHGTESGVVGDLTGAPQRHPHHISFLKQLDEIISIYTLSSTPQPSPVVVKAAHIISEKTDEEDASPSRSPSSESWIGSGGSLGIGSRSESESSSSSSSSESSSSQSRSLSSTASSSSHSMKMVALGDSSRLAESSSNVDGAKVQPLTSVSLLTSNIQPHPKRVWNLVSSQLRLLSSSNVPIELMRMAPTRFAHRNVPTSSTTFTATTSSSPVAFAVVFPLHSSTSSQPQSLPTVASPANAVVSIVSLTTVSIVPSLNGTLPCRSVTTLINGGGGKVQDLHMCPSSWPLNEDDCPFSCVQSTSSSISKDSSSSSSSSGGILSIDMGRGFIGGQTLPITTNWRGYNSGPRCQFYHGLLMAAALFPPRGAGTSHVVGTSSSTTTTIHLGSDNYLPDCQYPALGETRALECAGLIQPKIRISSLIRSGKNTYEEFHRPMAMPTWKVEVGAEVAPEPLSNIAAHIEETTKLKACTLSLVSLSEVALQFGCAVSEWDAVLSAPHRTSNHQYIGGALLRRESYFTVLVTGRSSFWKDILTFLANSSKSVAHLLNAPKPPPLTKNSPLHAYNGVVAVKLAQTVMKYYRGIVLDMHKSTFVDLSPKSSSWSPMPFQEAAYALSLITLWYRYDVYPSSVISDTGPSSGLQKQGSSTTTMPAAPPVLQPHVDFGVYSIGHTSCLSDVSLSSFAASEIVVKKTEGEVEVKKEADATKANAGSPIPPQPATNSHLPHFLHCCAAETAVIPEPYVSPADLCTSMLSLDRAHKSHLHHEINAVSFILSLDETFDFNEAFNADQGGGLTIGSGVSVGCDTEDLPLHVLVASGTTPQTLCGSSAITITKSQSPPVSTSVSPSPEEGSTGVKSPVAASCRTFCYRKPLAAASVSTTAHTPSQLSEDVSSTEKESCSEQTEKGEPTPWDDEFIPPPPPLRTTSTTTPLAVSASPVPQETPSTSQDPKFTSLAHQPLKISPSHISSGGGFRGRVPMGVKRTRVSPPPLQTTGTSILPPPPLPLPLQGRTEDESHGHFRDYDEQGGWRGGRRGGGGLYRSTRDDTGGYERYSPSVMGHFDDTEGGSTRTDRTYYNNSSQQYQSIFVDGPSRSPTMDHRYPPLLQTHHSGAHHQSQPTYHQQQLQSASISTSPNNYDDRYSNNEYRPDRDYSRHEGRRNDGYHQNHYEDVDRHHRYPQYNEAAPYYSSSNSSYGGDGSSRRDNNNQGQYNTNKPPEKRGFGLMKKDRYR